MVIYVHFYYSVFNTFFYFYYLIYKQIDQENNSSVGAITGDIRGQLAIKRTKVRLRVSQK